MLRHMWVVKVLYSSRNEVQCVLKVADYHTGGWRE